MRRFRGPEGNAEKRLHDRLTRQMSELLRPEDFIWLEVRFYLGRCVVLGLSAWSPVSEPGQVASGWDAFLGAALVCGFSDISTDPGSLPIEARWFTYRACTPIEAINGFTADSR